MIIDQCRLDTMVIGPTGKKVPACLAVILTPALATPGPFFSYRLTADVDEHFRGLADAVRDVIGADDGRTVLPDGDFLDHEQRDAQ
jgi:hypothetical protein